MHIKLKQLEDTENFAKQLVQYLHPGQVICMVGDLGAGKTTMTQFICRLLGVDDYITSPTFNLINSYVGKLEGKEIEIHHFDVYRIFEPDEMLEIGFDDYLFSKGISIVEWANQVEDMIPEDSIWLKISFDSDGERVLEYDGGPLADVVFDNFEYIQE
ncbi:tRNA (adenosine(37)-N6)-threonylcarbamoyltransferase complex ATPase subunit type 1 TsaE [Fusibacter bizertensis]